MTGVERLIQMRLNGRVPDLLRIDLDIGRLDMDATLQIQGAEPLHSLDLRSVQGLVVSVGGCGPRVKAIGRLCEESGAWRVITNTYEALPEGRFEIIEVTDTSGVFVWAR